MEEEEERWRGTDRDREGGGREEERGEKRERYREGGGREKESEREGGVRYFFFKP